MRFLLEDGTIEDRNGSYIQCGDRVLDASGSNCVVLKIMPPYLILIRENNGELIKISTDKCTKTRWM